MKVIVYNIFGLGHINPTLPLITSLVRAGAHVIYHTSPDRRNLIESTGAEFRNYGRDDYKAADFNPGKNFVLQTLPATLGLLPFLSEEIKREKPDLLIYDSMAPWGLLLAHIFKLPAVCSVTTLPLSRSEKYKTFGIHNVEPDELNDKVLREIDQKFNLKLDFDCVLGAYNNCNLVFGAGALNLPSEFDPGHFHFIATPERAENLDDFPFEIFQKKKRKVITMALGTLLPEEDPSVIEWYRCLLRAFSSDERFQIVIATGNSGIREKLGPLAPNVIAREKIPQQAVLKYTNVFIHHGGMNSVSESAAAGVPMIVIPHSKDQFANARKVVELRTGKEILPADLTDARLKAEVLDLMFSPKFQGRVQAIKEQLLIHKQIDPLRILQQRAL